MKLRRAGIITGAALAVVAVVGGFFFIGSTWTKADGGEVIVVRNGGWLDDNSFREVVPPNSSLTYTGLWSQEHPYPASQRYFTISSAETADSNEVINVPTKDGVFVGVEGTFYFELNNDPAVLERFDNEFGTRTFPIVIDGEEEKLAPWEENGWVAFLDANLSGPALTASRQEISKVDCTTLIASCALIQPGKTTADVAAAAESANPQTITATQDQMASTFQTEINKVLGDNTFVNVKFVLAKVELPQNLKDTISQAQVNVTDANGKAQAAIDTARGQAAAAQQAVEQAKAEAASNAARQEGYNACPVCQQIDLTKALPQSLLSYGGEAPVLIQPPAPAPAG